MRMQWFERLRWLSCVVMLGCAAPSVADLRILGDTQAAPGGTFTVRLNLDAPLPVSIDDLTLAISFDPATFFGESAIEGPLIAGGLVDLSPATGTGVVSFLLGLPSGFPAGDLATWTFSVALGATPGFYPLQASLETFVIDGVDSTPTANLTSAPFQVQVVPEPATYAFLLAGLATLCVLRRRGRRGPAA